MDSLRCSTLFEGGNGEEEKTIMLIDARHKAAVARLRGALSRVGSSDQAAAEIAARDQVLSRYGPVFSLDHITELDPETLKAFLLFENNQHWSGLHRHGNRICQDMDKLRAALTQLLDEERPLAERLDQATTSVNGLGKAITTAILLVAYPDKYGAWNNTSEGALRELGIWPDFDRGASLGQKYEQVSTLLIHLAEQVDTDLWTLDALYWFILRHEERIAREAAPRVPSESAFGLERHLHDFMRDNWDSIELGQAYALYEENGEEAGYEFPTDVGRIDLLAQHRTKGDLLVIELKRGPSGDATVGQVLRYMGWVRRRLAQGHQKVRGMIIAHQAEPGLVYAVDAVPDVELRLYEVSFRLRPGPGPDETLPRGRGKIMLLLG